MHPHRSPRIRHRALTVLALVSLAAGAAACSSDAAKSVDTTTPPATTDAPTTTEAPTTTTVAATTTTVVETTTTVPETTTTVPETTTTVAVPKEPIYPLTGITNPDPNVLLRPALIVKIDNAPGARPQSGFNEADIVVEELVNDNLTRFALVFHSGNASSVGPIRSGRIQDIDLFTALDHPLFAWSGGNKTVTDRINTSELVNIGPNNARDAYYRTKDKKAPHNLYSSTDALFSKSFYLQPSAKQQFNYRSPDAPVQGTPSPGVAVKLDSIEAGWTWNAETGLYERTMEGKPHNDALSGRVTTNNVLVLAMEYVPGISDSPDAQTIATGEAFIFTGGNYIHGIWSRGDAHEPFALRTDDGTPILLTPGRTFIELPRINSTIPLP